MKPKYRGRTTKIKKKIKNLPINYLTDKISTTLPVDSNCFNCKGRYLYIGTVLSEYEKYGEDGVPKMGNSQTNVLQTITDTPNNRYSKNDSFIVTGVITINEEILDKFNVSSVIELESLIRKKLNFIRNLDFNGNEWWSNETCKTLLEKMNEFLFGRKDVMTYEPRPRQLEVIEKIKNAFKVGKFKNFLLGAMPRFGKNFSSLHALTDLLKGKEKGKILYFTNKPSTFKTLENDVDKHIKFSDYGFVDLKNNKELIGLPDKCVIAASKQLLENSKNSELLELLSQLGIDFIVIDECHSGIETINTQKTLNKFKNVFKLYMSGTPQKQLGKLEFNDESSFIYDECNQLEDYKNGLWNDAVILNSYLISLNEKSIKEFKKFMSDEGLFKFTKFFQYTNGVGFVYETIVREFISNFFGKNKFRENLNFFGKFNHLLILLPPDTQMIIELSKLISEVLGDEYSVIAATSSRFKRKEFEDALVSGNKTIVLTCDKLIEGETVDEWECAINMSDTTSFFKYTQFAYRPTSPDKNNKNKRACFFDLNPETHISMVYQKYLGLGYSKEKSKQKVKEYYENHNIFSAETVNGFTSVNFEKLWKAYNKTTPSLGLITGNINWGNRDTVSVVNKLLRDIEIQSGVSNKVEVNNSGIDGGRTFRYDDNDTNVKDKERDKVIKEVIEKLPIIISRAPMIMIWERDLMNNNYSMEKIFEILNEDLFEGAFGIEKEKFKKIWEIPNFIDRDSMNFDISNLVTSNL